MSEVDAFLEANYLLPASSKSPAARRAGTTDSYRRLSVRTRALLKRVNISSTQDLRAKSIQELLEVPEMDAEALGEIVTWCPSTVRDEQDLLLILVVSDLMRTRLKRRDTPTSARR